MVQRPKASRECGKGEWEHAGLYGQGTKVDGWAIRPKEAEETRSDPMELSVEEAMHLHAIKAEMLCPKM